MSAAPSYQTVRLSRGRHGSPEEGACVMELASMLSGSRFSDWLYCVDPAIMAFLWGYHDHISDELRQADLYRYAGAVLDTRRTRELTARRAEMCRVWALQAQCARRSRLPWPIRFQRRGELDGLLFDCEFAGIAAARLAGVDPAWHTWTLRFVDALVWLGSDGDELVALSAVGAQVSSRRDGGAGGGGVARGRERSTTLIGARVVGASGWRGERRHVSDSIDGLLRCWAT